MRKICLTMVLVATLGSSLQASARSMCDAWLKEWANRTEMFNSECVRSSLNYSRGNYCKQEAVALERERINILHQCR